MLWVGGGVAVLPLSVVLVTLLVRAPPAELRVLADGEGAVGGALVDGGVLTVPWRWDLATPGGGSRGRCWPMCWPWRCLLCLWGPPMILRCRLIPKFSCRTTAETAAVAIFPPPQALLAHFARFVPILCAVKQI